MPRSTTELQSHGCIHCVCKNLLLLSFPSKYQGILASHLHIPAIPAYSPSPTPSPAFIFNAIALSNALVHLPSAQNVPPCGFFDLCLLPSLAIVLTLTSNRQSMRVPTTAHVPRRPILFMFSSRQRVRRARLERARGAVGRDLASGIGEKGASSEVGATVLNTCGRLTGGATWAFKRRIS